MNKLKNCNMEITEIKKWKLKANLVCIFPVAYSFAVIFILVHILMHVPSAYSPEPQTMTIPTSVEPGAASGYIDEADASIPVSGSNR